MEVAAALADIINEIHSIELAAAGRSLQDFQARMDAEACGRAWPRNRFGSLQTYPSRSPGDAARHSMEAGLCSRNPLRHEYHRTDDEIIWRVVTDDLAALRLPPQQC